MREPSGYSHISATSLRPSSAGVERSASARRSGRARERSSSPTPSGACAAKSARCSLENSLRIGRSAGDARSHVAPAPSAPFSVPEQTNPPGSASTSTRKPPDRRRLVGQLGGDDRPQLHDRVVALALDAAGADDDAVLVEREVGRVEEEDLADLRLERVEPERDDRRAVVRLGHGQLQLDAVRVLDQLEESPRPARA